MQDLLQAIDKAKPGLSLNAILKKAFTDKKDRNRVRSKIDRGTPELTTIETKAVMKALDELGIKLEQP